MTTPATVVRGATGDSPPIGQGALGILQPRGVVGLYINVNHGRCLTLTPCPSARSARNPSPPTL